MGAESANFKIIIQFARQVCDGQNASLGKKEKKDENIATGSRMGLFYCRESV
jgi:hypothetical protein